MDKLYSTGKAIDTINKILKENEMSQKEVSTITGAAQPNVSKILSKTKTQKGSYKFFTVEQLVKLSLELDVSLDELLGIERNEKEKRLTARDICKFFVDLEKKCLIRLSLDNISADITRWMEIDMDDVDDDGFLEAIEEIKEIEDTELKTELMKEQLLDYSVVNEKYPCIYFSEWYDWEHCKLIGCGFQNDDDSWTGSAFVTMNGTAIFINNFLDQWCAIKKLKNDHILDKEKYDRLLESFLNDVPDNF